MAQFRTKPQNPGVPQGMLSATVQDAGNIATAQVYTVVQFGVGAPSGTSEDTALYIDTTAATAGSIFYHSPGNGSGYTNLP